MSSLRQQTQQAESRSPVVYHFATAAACYDSNVYITHELIRREYFLLNKGLTPLASQHEGGRLPLLEVAFLARLRPPPLSINVKD